MFGNGTQVIVFNLLILTSKKIQMKGEKHMKKYYKLNFKNYTLITLYIISIILLIGECENLKTLLITKIIGLTYFIIFTFKNIIYR